MTNEIKQGKIWNDKTRKEKLEVIARKELTLNFAKGQKKIN